MFGYFQIKNLMKDRYIYIFIESFCSCLAGYCCQQQRCNFDHCEPNRTGPLCGTCRKGYSESLFSAECIPDKDCTYATIFWLIIAVYGLFYIVFFVCEEEINVIVNDFSAWVKKRVTQLPCFKKNKKKKVIGSATFPEGVTQHADLHTPVVKTSGQDEAQGNNEEPVKPKKEGAYLAIFMYYVQVPDLLKIRIFYINFRSTPFETISDSIQNIFSFNTFGLHLNTCIFKGVTAIVKTWIKSAFILYLFLIWGIVFIIVLPFNHLFRKTTLAAKWPTDITLKARFLAALVNLLLYTYQYFAENSFNMLKCISIVGRPKPVIFIDAQKECYENWQFGIFAFTVVYVLPFSIVLLYAPSLLYRRLISVKLFIISVLLPLFSSPYLIYLFYKHKRPKQEQYRAVQSEESTPEMSIGSVDAIVGVIFDPYRQDLGYGLCWEGVIAFRRLILVITATLISDVLIRHLILTLICLFSLLMHLKIKPFVKQSCNVLENISLTILTIVSTMNLLKSSYFESGESPRETADNIMFVYDWIEASLLGLIPIAIGVVAALAILTRIFGFIIYQSKHNCTNQSNQRTGQDVWNSSGKQHNRTAQFQHPPLYSGNDSPHLVRQQFMNNIALNEFHKHKQLPYRHSPKLGPSRNMQENSYYNRYNHVDDPYHQYMKPGRNFTYEDDDGLPNRAYDRSDRGSPHPSHRSNEAQWSSAGWY